jgi:surface antigen
MRVRRSIGSLAVGYVALLLLGVVGFVVGGAVGAPTTTSAKKTPSPPVWMKSSIKVKAGSTLKTILDPGTAKSCKLTSRGPYQGQKLSWSLKAHERLLKVTLKTKADATPGRWLMSLVCKEPTGQPLSSQFSTQVLGNGGTRLIAEHSSLKISTVRQHRQSAMSGSISKKQIKVPGRGGGSDPGDDYPAVWKNAPQDSMFDNWREYNRECTSFAAWALASRNGFNMPFYDNAKGWGPDARARGYTVNPTPAQGSIAWSNAGQWGHVAYVQGVSGGSVYIEEYNEWGNGRYDSRTVTASTFTGYIHFKDIAQTPPAPTTTQNPTPPPTTVTVTTTSTTTTTTTQNPPPPPPPPPPQTHPETTGGVAHTWTNYTNAGGTQGPSIPAYSTVQIACRITGFVVADGNPWWYRIASSPWDGNYYVSADAFYNNGATGGSLIGTPWVDPNVPIC